MRKLFLSLLFSVLLLIILGAYFIFETPLGLETTAVLAKRFLPGQLTIKTLHGRLSGPLALTQLHYDSPSLTVDIGSLQLDWTPLFLLLGRLDIDHLIASHVSIHSFIESNQPSDQPFKLPLAFNFHKVQLNYMTYQHSSDSPIVIQHASISASSLNNHIFIHRLSITSTPYTMTVKGKTQLSAPFDTELKGTVINHIPHPNLRAMFKIIGNNESLNADFQIQKPYTADIHAIFNHIQEHGPVSIQGQWNQLVWPLSKNNFLESPYGTLTVTGTLKNYQAQISTLVKGKNIPSIQIQGRAQGNWQAITLQNLTLHLLNGVIALQGTVGKRSRLTWQAQVPNLSQLYAPLKGSVVSTGLFTGSLDNPTIQTKTTITALYYEDNVIQQLNLNANINLSKNSQLDLLASGLTLNHFPIKTFTLHARGNKSAHTLQALMNSDVMNVQCLIAGSYKKKSHQWYETLKEGHIDLPTLGLQLTPIVFSLTSNDLHRITIQGRVFSNHQPLQFSGAAMLNKQLSPAEIKIQGTNVPLINTKKYKINLSPSLNIRWNAPDVFVTGDVNIPYALITPDDFTTTTELPNTVVFTTDKRTQAPFFKPHAQVHIILGNDILVKYAGLNAGLAGGIQLAVSPQGLTTTTGSINAVNGYYAAYGEQLNIKNGVLTYTGGPIDNPGLNILAVKNIKVQTLGSTNAFGSDTIQVGVQVTGTLSDPKLTLYSVPPMTNNSILSYLLFGSSSDNLSGAQYKLIEQAASSMGLLGGPGGGLVGNLQKNLGVDELGIQSNQVLNPANNQTEQNTSFVVGKKLSNRLSVTYSTGLLLPVNVLTVQYQLSQHWAVQTDASNYGSGGDILYSIEKN